MELGILFLLLGGAILTGMMGILINKRTQIPDSLLLIVLGFILGPLFGILGSETVNEYLPAVSLIAMVVILLDSGISFDISKILGMLRRSVIFTLSVAALTTILIAGFLVYFFGWELGHAALLGLVASGTTTITAMSLLKGLKVDDEVRRLILLETIINDLTLILGAFIIIDIITFSTLDIPVAVWSVISDIGLGIIAGVVFCYVWRNILKKVDITRELNYISTLGICFLLYFTAETMGGNAIIAIFTFSLLFGNYKKFCRLVGAKTLKREEHSLNEIIDSIESTQINFTFFMKSLFFVLLGATFNFSILNEISVFLILGTIAMILIARFISSEILSYIDKTFEKYKFLITVMVPRGYVAAVLAFIPTQYGIEIPMFTDIVVVLVVATSVIAMIGVAVYSRTGKKK